MIGTTIEGFGDDFIYGFVGFLVAFITILVTMIYWAQNYNSQQSIHPDSQANVQSARQSLGERHTSTRTREVSLTCPICLGEASYAIETNCAHIFCAECIVTYWRTGNWLGAVRCPVCRQTVTVLLRHFTEEERGVRTETKTLAEGEINHYNRRFSGEPLAWIEYIRELPIILRHLMSEFFSVGGLVWMFRLRIVVLFLIAFFYFISPLDIIPEAAFGILGFLDDLFILLLLAIYISIIYRRVIAERGQIA